MGTDNEDNFLRQLGNAIRIVRIQRKLTQKELAQKSGISLRYLILIEQGKVSLTVLKLERLCRSLRVKLSDFYDNFVAIVN